MATYKAELSFDNLQWAFPAVLGSFTLGQVILGVAFQMKLTDFGNTPRITGILLGLQAHSFGAGPTLEWQTVQQEDIAAGSHDPIGQTPTFQTLEANGQNGAALIAAPQILSIQVDDAAQLVTYTGALGSHSHSFAALGWAAGAVSAVGLDSLAVGFQPPDNSANRSFSADLYGFWLSKDGTRVAGAQLGTGQPGNWAGQPGPLTPWRNDPALPGSNTPTTFASSTRLTGGFSYSSPLGVGLNGLFRAFTGGLGEIGLILDLLTSRFHGTMWYARVVREEPESVKIGVSEDGGLTFSEMTAVTLPGALCASPSLVEDGTGALLLYFHDGTALREARSENLGRSFGSPPAFFLPALPWTTQTTPVVVLDPAAGLKYIFYNAGGHLRMQRFDQTTVGPVVTLASGLSADVYAGAAVLFEEQLTVIYNDGSQVTQQHSDNLGASFTTDFTAGLNARAPRLFWHPAAELTFELYGVPPVGFPDDRSLEVFVSEDGGITVLHPPAGDVLGVPNTVKAQAADIERTPLGAVIVGYQRYDPLNDRYLVAFKRSEDYGFSWA